MTNKFKSHNDITNDLIQTRIANNAYRDGWDRVFGERKYDEPQTQAFKTSGWRHILS